MIRPAPSLSVVIPLFNEQDNVAPLVLRVHQALNDFGGRWELLLVDDGSRDATHLHLCEAATRYGAHVRILRLGRNFGQTAAMQAGIDAARGELIVTLDGDLQNDPADIPRLIDELQQRDLDLLAGRRAKRQDGWLLRRLPSAVANWLIARVTGVRLRDYGCSLKIYRASLIKQVRLYGEMHRFIPVWAAMVTAPQRIGESDVAHHPRRFGRSKCGLSRTVRVLLDLLTALCSCFLGYADIGAWIADDPGTRLQGNPYRAWIEMYAGEDFQDAATASRKQLDRLGEQRGFAGDPMVSPRWPFLAQTFSTAVRLEIGFWDMGLDVTA